VALGVVDLSLTDGTEVYVPAVGENVGAAVCWAGAKPAIAVSKSVTGSVDRRRKAGMGRSPDGAEKTIPNLIVV
jgi:hypothetical protein